MCTHIHTHTRTSETNAFVYHDAHAQENTAIHTQSKHAFGKSWFSKTISIHYKFQRDRLFSLKNHYRWNL